MEQMEKNFSMPLSDLGDPDQDFDQFRRLIQDEYGYGGGHPGLAKWTVQEAAGGSRQVCFEFFEDGGFYIYTVGRQDEPEAYEAEVHYTGKMLDGTVFASSKENGTPLMVQLAQEDEMQGFILAIASMQPGEKAVFTIPLELLSLTMSGYPASIPWKISPNQTSLRFDIELISLTTDILGDDGILKKTIRSGQGKYHPGDSSEVLVNYLACLKDGTLVSQSEGVEFILAEGFFCPAIRLALKTMTKGEESILVIKPQYGFGEGRPSSGNKFAVPPDATLHVKLQLMSWKTVCLIGEHRDILKRTPHKENSWPGDKLRNEAVVKVRMIGKLEDGTVFDRRGHDGDDPFEFTIGKEQVINGVEEAVMTMEVGEISYFTIPPQHAFGAFGSSQYQLAAVPPNSVVMYEIELISLANEDLVDNWVCYPCAAPMVRLKQRHEHSGRPTFVPPRKYDAANATESTVPAPAARRGPTPPASPAARSSSGTSRTPLRESSVSALGSVFLSSAAD